MKKFTVKWKELAKRGLLVLLGLVVFASFVPEGALPVYAQGGEDSSEVGGTGEGAGAAGTSGNTGAETGGQSSTQSTGTDTAGSSAADQSSTGDAASSGAEASSGSDANGAGSSAGATGADETGTGVSGAASQAAAKPQQAPKGVQGEGGAGTLAAGVPFEVLTLTSTNAGAYVTNSTNTAMLTVAGTFSFTDATQVGTASDTLTIRLTNNANARGVYFTAPVEANINWPVGAADKSIVTEPNGDVVISCTLTGAYNTTGNFTVVFPFDHNTHDAWVPNGATLATVTAQASMQATEKKIDVTGKTTDPNGLSVFNKTPAGDVTVDTENILTMNFSNGNNVLPTWYNEPGSTMVLGFDYPAGAVVGGSLMPTKYSNNLYPPTGVDDGNGTVIWAFTKTAGADGMFPEDAGWSSASGNIDSYGFTIPAYGNLSISFPSDKFQPGETITLTAWAEYTRAGETEPTRQEKTITFKIKQAEIHLQEGTVSFRSLGAFVRIAQPTATSTNDFGWRAIRNVGGAAIPNLCLTVQNDPSAQKANFNTFYLANNGKQFKIQVRALIKNDAGGADRGWVTLYVDQASAVGGYATFYIRTSGTENATTLVLQPGEYVETIEFYPLNNPNDSVTQLRSGAASPVFALPYPAEFSVSENYTSWPGGVFPDGTTAIQHGDISRVTAMLTWEDESYPETHVAKSGLNNAVYSQSGNTSMLTYTSGVTDGVRYSGETPNPYVLYELAENQGGSRVPGEEVKAYIRFKNHANGYANWVDPVLLVFPPDALELDMSKTVLPVTYGTDPTPLAQTAAVEEITIAGRRAYKITVTGLSMPASNSNGNAMQYKIPVTFKVRAGTTAGTYYLAKNQSNAGYTATCGMLVGTSNPPNGLLYPLNVATNPEYFADVDNLDGYTANGGDKTPYLKSSFASVSFTVDPSNSMAPTAYLLDNTANTPTWTDVATPGAQGTVQLSGTGQFQLEILNQGNSYLGDVQLLNVLPNTADGQGSQWYPYLATAPTVTVYDNNGDPVPAGTFSYSFQYCTNGNPSYNSGGLVRSGSGAFSNNSAGNIADAKSFLFLWDSSAANRLPAGYKIVIEGTLTAPASATSAQIGQSAYNWFTANAAFYGNNTDNTNKQVSPQMTPNRQKFVLADSGTANLGKNGFVFKDINGDGKYTAGTDEVYEGVTVELYRDESGSPAESYSRQTTTDTNGQYAFNNLGGGDYYVKVILPTHATITNAYSFTVKGTDGVATDSHVNVTTGFSSKFTLNPGATATVGVNAGVIANATLTVEFRETNATGTLKKTVTDATMGLMLSPLPQNGTLTVPTTTGLTLPANYHIKSGTDTAKAYSLTWDAPQQTVVFVIESDDCTIMFDAQGGTPVPADQNLLPGTLVVKPATDPGLTGQSFIGWFTDPVAGDMWNFACDTAPVGGTTLYAQYAPIAYKLTFDYNGGGQNAVQTKYYQDPIAKPTDPTRTGYAFGGWFDEQGNAWNFATGTMPARNLTLKARWTLNSHVVTYVSEGATLDTKTVNYGALVPSFTPSRDGYIFQHWVLQGTAGAVNFATYTMPDNDITLVAVWQEIPASVPVSSSAASSSGSASRSVSSSSVASSSVPSVPVVTSTESVPPAPTSTSTAPQPTSGAILSPTLSEAFSNQSGNPLTDIFNGRVPTGGLDVVSAWSFVSLLLGVLGFFLSVLLLVTGLAKKRRGDDEQDIRYAQETGSDAASASNDTTHIGAQPRRPLALWLLSIFAGLLPGALFLLLDDISQPMVWFNRWTLLIAAVFAGFAVLVGIYLAVKKRRSADEQQDAEENG